MEIGNWESVHDLGARYRELRDLGLESNIAELTTFGFTIVEPDKVGAPGLAERLRDAIYRVVEKRTGVAPDPSGSAHSLPDAAGRPMNEFFWLLFEDQVFEEALMNPVSLALATYLVGPSCVLSIDSALLKGPTDIPLYLHTDEKAPSPLPPYAQFCNTTWLLSDYTKDNGALCFVPGSHQWLRSPSRSEMMDFGQAIPVEAPMGSLVVWSGNTWHGAFPRKNPGLRTSLLFGYARYYMRPAEPFQQRVTKKALDRNPARFAKLMGQDVWMGFEAEGIDEAKAAKRPVGLFD